MHTVKCHHETRATRANGVIQGVILIRLGTEMGGGAAAVAVRRRWPLHPPL